MHARLLSLFSTANQHCSDFYNSLYIFCVCKKLSRRRSKNYARCQFVLLSAKCSDYNLMRLFIIFLLLLISLKIIAIWKLRIYLFISPVDFYLLSTFCCLWGLNYNFLERRKIISAKLKNCE
jgi:hypothetical protein